MKLCVQQMSKISIQKLFSKIYNALPVITQNLFDEGDDNEVYNIILLWRCGCWIREN